MGVTDIPVTRAGEMGPGSLKRVDLSGRHVLVADMGSEFFAFAGK